MADALAHLTILVPESRELDLFASMLEAEGATTLRCPLVQILDLEETSEAQAWLDRLIAGAFEDVIWLTGEGLRRLATIADRHGKRAPFIEALGRLRSITRGPKPARALRELGLERGLAAVTPTSQGVLDALAGEDIAGRAIGVQLYPGDGPAPLIAALRARGADVSPVIAYRYASQAETRQVADVIRAMAAGRIDMIAFTSSPQVDRFDEVARQAGLEAELSEGLKRVRIAAVGPVVEEALRQRGIDVTVRPRTSFHLKPFVQAITSAWKAQ